MEAKSNKLLIGIILIILGIYFVANSYFNFRMGETVLFVLGGALLLLYHTKRKVWALISGVMIYTVWIFKTFPHLSGNIFAAAIFLIPGIIFMILYFSKYRNSFLVTGSIFTWFGIFMVLGAVPGLRISTGALFFICMGLSFFTMYLLNRYSMGKWTLILSIILIFLGISTYIGSPFRIVFNIIPSVVPIILIAVGIIIIIKAVSGRKQ